jgi:DNA (cytosine-5)-methyltransferase 1
MTDLERERALKRLKLSNDSSSNSPRRESSGPIPDVSSATSTLSDAGISTAAEAIKAPRSSASVYVQPVEDWRPYSAYEDWEPPLPPSKELDVLNALRSLLSKYDDSGPDVVLKDFVVYVYREPNDPHLLSLHELRTKRGEDRAFFDGIIEYKSHCWFVTKVQFSILTIAYEEGETVDNNIWIQSLCCEDMEEFQNYYYRLVSPCRRYKELYQSFLWIANFANYFFDYILVHPLACFKDFKLGFLKWLISKHSGSREIAPWLQNCKEITQALTQFEPYLWKEASGLDRSSTQRDLTTHKIWTEITADRMGLASIPAQPQRMKKTIVTPFVYQCFKDIYFASVLQQKHCQNQEVKALRDSRLKALGFPADTGVYSTEMPSFPALKPHTVHVGDIVAIARDSGPIWKDESPFWFGMLKIEIKATKAD